MAVKLAITNEKGGCGKTATAVNLAAILAERGYRTLLVDGDYQSYANNMSRVLGAGKDIVTNPYGNGHSGVDLINDVPGLPDIVAHSPGTVVFCQTGYGNNTGSSGNASYGNCVKLLPPGGMYTLYAHMSSVAVNYGQQVAKGQKPGVMGNTGNSYGAHLHFEVRDTNDSTVNPDPYLDADLRGCPTGNGGSFTPGTYQVAADVLTVRKGPGTVSDWLRYEQLSENAQQQIAERAGYKPNGYVNGMVCDVFEVKDNWGKTPSAWITARKFNRCDKALGLLLLGGSGAFFFYH